MDADRRQVTEENTRLAYAMTLRNELSGGTPTVRELEEAWREWTDLTYAMTTYDGTVALYCAYWRLGVGPGDEVLCSTYPGMGTMAPALFLAARPVPEAVDRIVGRLKQGIASARES